MVDRAVVTRDVTPYLYVSHSYVVYQIDRKSHTVRDKIYEMYILD